MLLFEEHVKPQPKQYICENSPAMFELGKTVVSEEILDEAFVCDLGACKGACCVAGSSGAPVEDDERAILKDIYPKVKPYLRPEGIAAIESQGTYVKGSDGEWETPLVDNKECAYVVFEGEKALCGIEAAERDGAVSWKKPVSCHLYPVRVRHYTALTAVNYHRWHICDAACSLGQELKVPIYVFVKEALVRKFGASWYSELEEVARQRAKGLES